MPYLSEGDYSEMHRQLNVFSLECAKARTLIAALREWYWDTNNADLNGDDDIDALLKEWDELTG